MQLTVGYQHGEERRNSTSGSPPFFATEIRRRNTDMIRPTRLPPAAAIVTPIMARPSRPAEDFDLPGTLRAVRAGDEALLAKLANRYYPRVKSLVHRRLRHDFRRNHSWIQSAFSTGDVVQNVFLRVLASLDNVRCTEESAFLNYLAAMVENHLLDALRHHQADRRDARRDKNSDSAMLEALAKAAPGLSPSHDASMREQVDALRSILQSLTGKQQEVWKLRVQRHRSFAEIADQLGYASADVAPR